MSLTDQAFADHALCLTRGQIGDLMSPTTGHADGPAMAQFGRLTEALTSVDKLKDVPSCRFPQEGAALNGLNAGLAQVQGALQNVVTNPAAYVATFATSLAASVDAIAREEDSADWLTEVQIPPAPAEAATKAEAGRDA